MTKSTRHQTIKAYDYDTALQQILSTDVIY